MLDLGLENKRIDLLYDIEVNKSKIEANDKKISALQQDIDDYINVINQIHKGESDLDMLASVDHLYDDLEKVGNLQRVKERCENKIHDCQYELDHILDDYNYIEI